MGLLVVGRFVGLRVVGAAPALVESVASSTSASTSAITPIIVGRLPPRSIPLVVVVVVVVGGGGGGGARASVAVEWVITARSGRSGVAAGSSPAATNGE